MKIIKLTSERKPVIFISYSHRDKDVVDGLWEELEEYTDFKIERYKETFEKMEFKWDLREEIINRPKYVDFTMPYISGDYFRSANCIAELMALFEKKNPKERFLYVMDPNYKNRFDKKHFDKEREKIIQHWEDKGEGEKAKFLKEKLLPILKREVYFTLDSLKEEDYKPIQDYITRAMSLENQKSIKRLIGISLIHDGEEREIALEEHKGQYKYSEHHYYFVKGELSFLFLSGEDKLSEYYYTEAIRLKFDYAVAFNNRGIAYGEQGKYEEAIKDFNKVIRIEPKNAGAYSNRGRAYSEQGKYVEAIKDYTEAIRIKPELAEAYYNRGRAYSEQEKYEEAIRDFTEAIRLKSDDADAYNNRGLVYLNKEKYEEAIKDFTKAININPQNAEAYYNRGNVYAKQGKDEEAMKGYNEAININPQNAEAYHNRGCVYLNKEKYEEAIRDFTEAIRLKSDDADAYHNRGVAYDDIGETEKAKADYAMAKKLNPYLYQ